MVQEKQRPAAADHEEVLEPFVLEIREQSASRAVQYTHSGRLSHILERAIAAIAIEPVRKTRRLADVEVFQAIAVKISHGQAVVPINVDPARSVQNRAPIINTVNHLISVRFGLPQSVCSNVNEDSPARPAQVFFARRPSNDSPCVGIIARPLGLPNPNAFFAHHIRPRANQVIPNVDVHPRR